MRWTLVGLLLLAVTSLHAQSQSVWVGASLDAAAEPNPAGHVCGLLGSAETTTFSITCLSARGGADHQPIYDVEQGVAKLLKQVGGFDVFALGTGGITTTSTGTNGMFSGGFAVAYKIKEGLEIVGAAKGAWSPALEDNAAPRFAVGFRYAPK